jgi:hypothetical protein
MSVIGDLGLDFEAPQTKTGRKPRGKAKPGGANFDDVPF